MSSKDQNSKPHKISGSLSASLKKNGESDIDESFRIGDFSSKHFTRKSSVFTNHSLGNPDPVESPNTKKIEGGFEDKGTATPLDSSLDLSQSERSYKSATNNFNQNKSPSALGNLISSSIKKDSFMSSKPSSTTLNRDISPAPQRPGTPEIRLSTDSPNSGKPAVNAPEIDVQNPDPSTVEAVGRHLVNDTDAASSIHTRETSNTNNRDALTEEFDSLQLQGGDISREVYNWQREHSQEPRMRRRSQSFSGSISGSLLDPDFQVHDIRVPGGFRRSFLVQKATKQKINGRPQTPTFFTRNFIEFLTLYGHFAGEELRDEDDEDEDEEEEGEEAVDEESLLLEADRQRKHEPHKATTTKAILLLLKAFIGTGVLFLPRGYHNAGWLFSSSALIFFSILSYWCFMSLINVKIKLNINSYGDIGGKLFGPYMRYSILSSIVLSQIGFAAAYIVFTATNLQAFFISIASKHYSIEFFIFVQLLVFIPLSLTRKIAKLSGTALIADLFILLGLVYVYYYCSFVVITEGVGSIKPFNKDWTVFIGTAIFTYEGIGLLIPIQESMQKPSQFPKILGWVMLTVTFVFVSAGGIGYLAFGSDTETVILLNFPQDSLYVSIVQFLYAMAILLSTPLQLFPAIRILENGIFVKSGKYDNKVKWHKNYFRVGVVLSTAFIAWGGASDLDRFVAIVGSFACIPLIYVYPPLLHYKLSANTFWSKAADIAVTALGFSMMIYTSGQTILDWIS
ncbi:unnamed protein product [Wickerhamomyces anomalus]